MSLNSFNSTNHAYGSVDTGDSSDSAQMLEPWYVICDKLKGKSENMDLDSWLSAAAKWILPFLGVLYLFKLVLGLNFTFGFSFL